MSTPTSYSKSALIVDDQQFFIVMMTPFLQEEGYEVLGCTNPVDAINTLKDKTFDIVFCDLHMPCFRGDKLLFQILRINPEQKCCLVTGAELDEPILRKTLRMKNVHGFLKKPVSYTGLKKVLDDFCNLSV